MGEVITMAALKRADDLKWSWCIPAGRSMQLKVVVVQVMSSVGRRFLPTRIAAPASYRTLPIDYVEMAPTEAEQELADSSLNWRMHRAGSLDLFDMPEIVYSLHDMLAAARFLPVSELDCEPAAWSVPDSELYLGRSVLVRPCGSRVPITAWITYSEEHFELVCLDFEGQPRRFVADSKCLMDDARPRSPAAQARRRAKRAKR